MKYLFLTIICFVIFTNLINAQVDSLTRELSLPIPDTTKINIWNELSFQLRYEDKEQSKQYAHQAIDLASKIAFPKGEAEGQNMLGVLSKNDKQFSEAETHFFNTLEIRDRIKDTLGMASSFNNLGNNAKAQGDYLEAKSFFEKGLDLLTNRPKEEIKAKIHNNLGNTYRYLGNHTEALKQIQSSITIRKELHDTKGMANCFLTLGSINKDLGNMEQSIEYYKESLLLFQQLNDKNGEAKCCINLATVFFADGQSDSTFLYFEKALALKEYLSKVDIATINRNMGYSYNKLNQYDKAIEVLKPSLELLEKDGNSQGMASVSFYLGQSYYGKQDFPSALKYYQSSLDKIKSNQDIALKVDVLYCLSETHSKLQNYREAFQYGNQSSLLNDSLNDNHITAINYQANLQKKQDEITILEKEQKLTIAENQKQRLIIGGLIGLFALALMLATALFYAYRNRQKKTIAEKNTELANQKVIEILNEQELNATYARLEGQDMERKRIAEDLHDRLGSMLSTVKLYFKSLDTPALDQMGEQRKQFFKANELLEMAANEVRKISYNMESGILTEFGLEKQLTALANTLRESGQITVDILTHGFKERLDSVVEGKVYRIIQELVNNTIKHANASNLSIQLNRFKEVLNILVEDNGRGFDASQIQIAGNGMGMKNVQSRLHDLKGEWHIDSNKDRGTTISIDIPLEKI